MRLRPAAPFAVLLLILGGCSSDGSDGDPEALDDGPEIVSETPSEAEEPEVSTVPSSEFTGRWKLIGYSLDDSTSRTVPDSASAQIAFGANEVLDVTADYCESFQVPYTVNDGVLTTTESITPEGLPMCDAIDSDDDSLERSALMYRALLNTQTMVAVSDDDVLTVRTGTNEVLVFERVAETAPAPTSRDDPDVALLERTVWLLASRRTADGLVVPTEGDLSRISLDFSPADEEEFGVAQITGSLECNGYSRDYELSDSMLEVGTAGVTDGECDGSTASPAAPFFVDMFLLGSRFAISTADGELTIDSDDGRRLTFIAENAQEFERVPFEELATGDLVDVGNQVFDQPRFQVLRDQESLDSLYYGLPPCAGPCEPFPLPAVDFTNSIVVFVAHEIETFTGVGIEVADVRLTERSDAVTVAILRTEPGDGCDVDTASSGPFAFYEIKTRVEPVYFYERTEAGPAC